MSDDARMRALLDRQVRVVITDTLDSGTAPSEERVAELERLERVEKLLARSPRSSRAHWEGIAAVVVTLVLANLLVFMRVSSTEVELDARTVGLSFVLPTEQPLTDATQLSVLKIGGAAAATLPRALNSAETVLPTRAIRYAIPSGARHAGSIGLGPLTLTKGTRVHLERGSSRQETRIIVNPGPPSIDVTLDGAVHVTVPGGLDRDLMMTAPRAASVVTAPGTPVIIEGAAATGSEGALLSHVPADSLSLDRTEKFSTDSDLFQREETNLLSGTLYLESLDGQSHQLRSGEGVRLSGATGELRYLSGDTGGIAFVYRGRVRDMSVGSGETYRSLMPTWLDWLRARHGIWLMWGGVTYAVGLAVGVMRWWKNAE